MEALEWLQSKHGITGDEAKAMVEKAQETLHQTAKKKAKFALLLSGIGTAFTVACVISQMMGKYLVYGIWAIAVVAIGAFSFLWLVRSMQRLKDLAAKEQES